MFLSLDFDRQMDGLRWSQQPPGLNLPLTGKDAWQSNGGVTRGHPDRVLPLTAEIKTPEIAGRLLRMHFVGVFALHACREYEPIGTLGGCLQLLDQQGVIFRQDLICGRHYGDATQLESINRLNGDGTSLETIGQVEIEGILHRVDLLTIDIPKPLDVKMLRLKDFGTPASFVIFDAVFEYDQAPICPFKSHGGGVSLAELGAAVRLGDRVKFAKAINQLICSIHRCSDNLDEARGLGLTFLAVISAALLELGASRELHQLQLLAARQLDRLDDAQSIADHVCNLAKTLATPQLQREEKPSGMLVDKALTWVDRNYAKSISDAGIANQLSISPSHFRFLFRQATGQPFHKYLIHLRLEKARQMLQETEIPICDIANAVGFASPAHFSRAFAKHFSASPSALRQTKR